jgi:short-subunit dehydrogenase
MGLLLTTKDAVAHMNGEGGSIINVSSIAAKTPAVNSSVYSATNGAVDCGFTRPGLETGAAKNPS